MGRVTVTVLGRQVTADYDLEPAPFYDLANDRLANWTLDRGKPNNALCYDLPANVALADGVMTIHGRRVTPSAATAGMSFTTGDAKGMHVRLPLHYTAVLRSRHDYGPGIWPCPFWARSFGGNPGEIDLMEQMGTEPRLKVTVHGPYQPEPHPMVGKTFRWDRLPNPDPAGWHDWRMVKSPGLIRVWCDDVLVATVTRAEAVAKGIDWDGVYENPANPQYPRINLQVASDGAAGLPDPGFTSCSMQVAGLRIWDGSAA